MYAEKKLLESTMNLMYENCKNCPNELMKGIINCKIY